ncbi:MAG: LptF/LptG family permease [candidate division Zixibacteria bacterium]
MKILSKYLIKESIGPFFFGLGIITIVLIMDFLVDIMNLIINRGINAALVIELFALNLAWMLALSVPMAVLVAVLMVFGRLAADNEITACKACGVPFYRLLLPALTAGLLLTLVMIWFSDRVLPESNHRARMLLTDITRKKPTWSLDENIFLDHFEGYHIRVKTISRKTSEIADIIIIQTIHNDRIITADRGLMYFSLDGSTLMLELEDGEILEVDSKKHEGITRTEFAKQTISIPGASSNLERSSEAIRGDREMTVAMMREQNYGRWKKLQAAVSESDSLVNNALSQLLAIPDEQSTPDIKFKKAGLTTIRKNRDINTRLTFLQKSASNYEREINSMEVEIQKKFSIPAACISFVLIGAPLGSMARKGGFATGIALSLFFFIVYWAFLIGGEQLADSGSLPAFWAMWLPNIFVGGAGVILNILYIRQSSVVSLWDRIISIFRPRKPREISS